MNYYVEIQGIPAAFVRMKGGCPLRLPDSEPEKKKRERERKETERETSEESKLLLKYLLFLFFSSLFWDWKLVTAKQTNKTKSSSSVREVSSKLRLLAKA